MNTQKIAKLGEKLAQNYLVRKKYSIIATNVKYREGEIDIVAKKTHQLIFVEVKTRTSWDFGYPEEALDFRKGQRLMAAVNRYIYETNYQGKWRVDLITLDLKGKKAALRHYQSVEIAD